MTDELRVVRSGSAYGDRFQAARDAFALVRGEVAQLGAWHPSQGTPVPASLMGATAPADVSEVTTCALDVARWLLGEDVTR